MVGLIENAGLAGREDVQCARGVVGRDEVDLAGHRALEADQDEALVAGLADAEIERRVLFLIDHGIGFWVGSQHVLLDPRREQRDRVVLDVVDGPVVAGPCDPGPQPGDALGEVAARRDLAETQRVLKAAGGVFGEGQQILPWADGPAGEDVIRLARGLAVAVDQNLLIVRIRSQSRSRVRAGARPPPRVDRVLLSGFETRGVDVVLVLVRDRAVVFLQPSDQLLVERFGERPVWRGHRLEVGVLGLQVVEHLGLGACVVAQPVVGIGARAMGRDHVVRFPGRDGRRLSFYGAARDEQQDGKGVSNYAVSNHVGILRQLATEACADSLARRPARSEPFGAAPLPGGGAPFASAISTVRASERTAVRATPTGRRRDSTACALLRARAASLAARPQDEVPVPEGLAEVDSLFDPLRAKGPPVATHKLQMRDLSFIFNKHHLA